MLNGRSLKLNIAVVLDQEIFHGGGFQYGLSIILLLKKNENEKYNFIFFTTFKKNIDILKKNNIEAVSLGLSRANKIFSYIKRNQSIYRMQKALKINLTNKFDRILKKYNIDLIYFITPSSFSLFTEQFNFIFTAWDSCHRDFPEFPEVNIYGEFEIRENLYKNALPKATKVITESDLGRINIINRYNLDADRVVSLSMLPWIASNANFMKVSDEEYKQNYVDIKKKYNIEGKYIFYPAQFWPHKNHIYILEGLKILKEKYNKKIYAVFSGSYKGNLGCILKKTKELGLEDQIYYIGFVDSQEMPYLYKQALALVMPTYFGPTNIPPLEAFKLGCPVLYSDLPGLRDQVKGAALLLDLKDPESLVKNLLKVIGNSADIKTLIANGYRIVESWTDQDYWYKLKEIFDEYAVKLKCWKQ